MEGTPTNDHETTVQPIENMVQIDDGKIFTTSLIVAQAFEKEHKNVLRDIENLECSLQVNELNFEPVEYKDAKGEMRPAYRLTRERLLVPGNGLHGQKGGDLEGKVSGSVQCDGEGAAGPERWRGSPNRPQ